MSDDDMVRCSDGQFRSVHSHPVVLEPRQRYRLEVPMVNTEKEERERRRRNWRNAPLHKKVWCYLGPILEFVMDQWFTLILVLLVIAGLAFIVVLFMRYVQKANSPSFTLQKDEWVCSMEHTQVSTSFIYTGKTMVPLTTSSAVCDRYDRRLR